MSKSNAKSETKPPRNIDLNDVEMVFGTPDSATNHVKPEVHISNEKDQSRDQPKVHKLSVDGEADAAQAHQPLLEPDLGRQKPPIAGPEIDDLDEKPADAAPYPGIDDGLLDPGEKKPSGPGGEEGDLEDPEKEGSHHSQAHDDGVGTEDGKWNLLSHGHDETDYFYGDPTYMGNGLHNRLGGDDRPVSPIPSQIIPDVNTYQQKKNLAQGMMDLALLSANANQLRYVLEASSARHPYFFPSLIFICCSIILQIAVGIGLIMNSRYDVNDKKEICKADKINNMTILGIFLITIVNVFITSFSVAPTGAGVVTAAP